MAYCDYIAIEIKKAIANVWHFKAGDIEWDLHPEEGYMLSTRKTLTVTDASGKMYKVTVEEA